MARALAVLLAVATCATVRADDTLFGGAAREVCGNYTLPLSSTAKFNVLVLGDSISMTPPFTPGGYGGALEKLLDPLGIHAQHAGGEFSGGQCGDTRLGLVCTNTSNGEGGGYLNVTGVFDVISFNYGLHDLANYSAALPRLPVDQYAANIVTIYKRLALHAKHVLWTTTTPVPDVVTSYGRSYQLAVEYNARALAALKAAMPAGQVLLVNDLWAAMVASCGAEYKTCALQLPANVHLSPAGIEFCAQTTAKAIRKVLGV